MYKDETLRDRKRQIAASFDSIAAAYDSLRFTWVTAQRLVEVLAPRAGEQVLDAATGTGWAAIAIAERVGSAGRVVGADLANALLEQARLKAKATGLSNLEFQQGDITRLDFPEHRFDAVACASAIFFLPDQLAALREWKRVIRPGGRVVFSSFGPTLRQPMAKLLNDRLTQYGIEALDTAVRPDWGACTVLLTDAGFQHVDVHVEQLGYFLPSVDAYWQEVWSSAARPRLLRLSAEQIEHLRAEHMKEVRRLVTASGLWVDVPACFASGVKPASP